MVVEDRIYSLVGAYTRAPQWIKTIAGSLYARLPASARFGNQYARFHAETLIEDPRQLRELALAKLDATLTWATETVPAYREARDARAPGQDPCAWLAQFPLLSKQMVKDRESDYVSDRIAEQAKLYAYTGGSTSVPMRVAIEKYVSRSKDFAYNAAFDRIAGVGARDLVVALRGRTVPGAERPDGPIWMHDPIKRYLHLSSDHLEPEHMPRYIDALRRWRPAFVHAFPSALYPLAWWLHQHPQPDITQRIRAIQLFSENVYPHQVELMREVFGCPVLFDYGHTERAAKATSIADDPRYFFWPLYGKVELVDFSGRPITQGGVLGEIVATGFDNRVMPLIRYRTGDLGMWSTAPNDRRPGFAVVDRIEGRLQEFLVCRDRRLVSITTIGVAHFAQLAGADLMQFEQMRPGHAVLKVASRNPLPDDVRRALGEAIRAKTQDGLSVDVVVVARLDRTASGKHNLLVQRLDISSFLGAAGSRRSLAPDAVHAD